MTWNLRLQKDFDNRLMEINTAGDDTENTGDYYVWLTLKSGEITACYRGTLDECKAQYENMKKGMREIALS